MNDKVYVLDITGWTQLQEIDGHLSVHATEKSAVWKLLDFIHANFNIDPRGDDVQIISQLKEGQPEHIGTSIAAADLELPDGTIIQYAITPYEIEELA